MSETCWDILGIEPTHDEKTIKKAYALKLRDNKPDKNPAGFRALREAYEQALDERFWLELSAEDDSEFDAEVENEDSLNAIVTTDTASLSNDSPLEDSPIDEALDSALLDDSSIDEALDSEALEEKDVTVDDSLYPLEQTPSHDVPLLTQAETQLSQWQNKWQDSIVDTSQPLIDSDDSEQDYFYSNDYALKADHEAADQLLFEHLTQQFEQLKDYPLDILDDYEQSLIVFFDDYPKAYSESYFLAKSHFDWQQHIDGWDHYDYPWYLLRHLDDSYTKRAHFDTQEKFLKYIASKYPLIYHHWDFELPESQTPSRWQFIRAFKWPHHAYAVKQQLDALDLELSQIAADSLQEKDWRNHPQFLALKQRLGGWGVVKWIDLVLLVIIGRIFFRQLENPPYYPNAHLDYFIAITVCALVYLYWQYQLSFFARPERFILPNHVQWGWTVSSVFLGGLFAVSTTITDAPPSAYYWGAHLAGFSALHALNVRNQEIGLKSIMDMAATLLLTFTVGLPLIDIATGAYTNQNIEITALTPPFAWILMMAPLIFTELGKKSSFFAYIGNYLAGLALLGSMLLILVVLSDGLSKLYSANLFVSAVLLTISVAFMVIIMFKSVNYFNQSDYFDY